MGFFTLSRCRKQGYVFWNKTRLEAFPQFCAPRTKERKLTELPPEYTDYVDTPGVVARLADLTVDVQVVTAISEEIRDETQPGDAEDHKKAEDAQDSENEKDTDEEKRAENGNHAGDERNAEEGENAGDTVGTDEFEDPEYPEPVLICYAGGTKRCDMACNLDARTPSRGSTMMISTMPQT
jgi:hypothetical protein